MAGVGAGVDKLTVVKSFKPAAATTNVFSGKLNNLAIASANAGISVKKFNSILKENNLLFVKGAGIYDLATNKFQDIARVTKMASVQAKRFKFEWLSVMFAGMALSRAFGGLVKTQFQLFGVTDTLGAAWTTVLLPVIEAITPFLFLLLDAFMNLSPEMKLAVGIFVLAGAAIGGILVVVGQVALAVGGIALLFNISFAAAAAAVAGVILVIAGIALIIGGVTKIIKNWGKDWSEVVSGISIVLVGLGLVIAGIALIIGSIPLAIAAAAVLIIAGIVWVVSKIIKNWDSIKVFLLKMWDAIVDVFVAAGKFIGEVFSTLWTGIKSGLKAVGNFIITMINNVISGVETMLNFAIKGMNMLIRLANKIPGVNIGTIGEIDFGRIPTFQSGGMVDQTGLALVHKGEKVIPRSEVNRGAGQSQVFSPTIEVTIENMNSNVDIDLLTEEINRKLAPKFEGFAGRGSI